MRFLLLIVAAVIAVFAGVAAMQLTNKTSQPTPVVQAPAPATNVATVDGLVARQAIPAGTVLNSSMVDRQPWPQNLVLEGFIASNSPNANIDGKVTRSPLQAREPLILSKLGNMNDAGFLAASLPAGQRAV